MSFLLKGLTGGKVDESIKPKEFEKYSDILPKSQFVPKKGDYWDDPSPTTKWRNLPKTLGGGQYAYDPERSQALVKSMRQFTPDLNREMRQGLSSRFFQVDHIIPLWAGGSDNQKNKQTLTTGLHDKKTKVGAIARTLYYNKDISLSDAKSLLTNWQNKDIEGIEINENGELASDSKEALVIAQHRKHEWDNPGDIKVSVGDVVEEMKRGWLGQLAGGAVAGFTGHWVDPYKFEDEEKTTGEKVSRFVGELGGMLAGLKGLQSVLARGAKAVGLGNLASSWGKSRWLSGSDASIRAGKVAVPRRIGMKVLQNAGLFTVHGQLSKQESNDVETRAKRFLSDAAFGSLVSIPGNSLKGYAGLAGGVYALSAIEGATPKESLFNSALMVGFHTLGHKSRNREVNDLAIKESLKFRTKYGIGSLEKVEQDIASGRYIEKKYTVEEINIQNEKAFESLRKELRTNENVTPEHVKAEVDKIIITGRQLYKGGLGVEKRLTEDIIDMRTTVRRENAIKKFENAGVPEPIYNTLTKDAEKILNFGKEKLSVSQAKFIKENKSNIIDGRVKVVGTARGMDGEDIIKAYEKGLRAGDNVIAVTRPDMKDFVLAKNIDKSLLQKTPNPENNIQILALVDKDVYRLGMLPSEAKINTMPFNINEAMRRFGMEKFDPKFNKDTISEAMKNSKVEYLVGKIEHITPKAKEGKQPSVTITITKESYSASKGLTKAETIKKETELKTKRASERIIGSTLTRKGRTFFTPIIQDIEKALLKKSSVETKKHFKENLGIKLTDAEVKSLSKKETITLKEVFDMLKRMKEDGRMDEKGKNLYELLLGKQGFYDKLNKRDKDFVGSLKLLGEKAPEKMSKVEAVKGKVVVEKPITKEEIDQRIKEVPIKKEKDDVGSLERGEVKPDEMKKDVFEEEIVISKKKDTFEDWLNYEGGVHKGGGKAYDNAINKLREKGLTKEADTLADKRNLLNRENLERYAKEIYNKNDKNEMKGFKEFKERYGKKLEEIGEKNPFKDHDNSQALKHSYNRALEIVPIKQAFISDGKLNVSSNKGRYKSLRNPDCFAGNESIKKYKDNPIEIVRVDIGNSKFSKKAERNPTAKKEEIIKTFEDDGYYIFGISKNALKDIVAIKKNQKLIDKFDKNPATYLPEGESIKAYTKGANEKTKMLRVYAQDVLGYSKKTSTDIINKRIPLTHNYELKLPWKGNVGVDMFVSPKVVDGKFPMFDGCTIITESLAKKVNLNGGFLKDRACYKMSTAHRVDGYHGLDGLNRGNLLLMKNEVFVVRNNDRVYKTYFDKMIEEKYGKGKKFEGDRVITFTDNVKVGEEIFNKNNNFLEIPAKAFRYEYNKPHNSAASTSVSMWGQFSQKDGVNQSARTLYENPTKEVTKTIDDLNNRKSIKETLKKHEIDIDASLHDNLLLKVNNGAGLIGVNKSLHDIVNQIFNKKILHGSFVKGDHLTLIPDIGVLPGGKMLPAGDCVISRATYNKLGEKGLKQLLLERFPITNLTAGSRSKVHIAEELGVTSLKDNCIVISQKDVFKWKQGDYDGDSIHGTSIGEKPNQIPQKVADAIESRRIKEEKEGGFNFEDQIPHEKTSFTSSNSMDHIDHVVYGTTGINHTMSTKRIMESLVDAEFRAKTRADKGKVVVDIFLGTSKKRFSYFNTKEKVTKDFVPEEIKVEYGKNKQEAVANLQQACLDSPTKKNLSTKMKGKGYDKSYIWEEILGTNNPNFINAISSRAKIFQKFFQLDPKKRADLKNNEDIFKRIEEGNALTDLILESGGKIGPVQEIFKMFKGAKPLEVFYTNTPRNRRVQFNYDNAGRNAVIEKYSNKFDIVKNEFGHYSEPGKFVPGKTNFILDKDINKNINRTRVYKIISEVKKMSEKHSKDYNNKYVTKEFPATTDSLGKTYSYEDISMIKRELKGDLLRYWDKEKIKLNSDEKEAVAYYLTTSYDAIINNPNRFLQKNIDTKEMLIFRLDSIFNEASSPVSKTYYNAAESAEKVITLKKYLEEKNVKIEEKAVRKLIESPVKGKQWLVDLLKKNPIEKYKNIVPKK